MRSAQPMVSRKFPTHYRTAEVLYSGKIYKVRGQNRASKDDVTHLALEVDGYTRWFPIAELHAVM